MTSNAEPEVSVRTALLRSLIRARHFDRVVNKINPGWHPATGEEAIPVGVFSGLRPDDISTSHYRSAMVASMVRGGDVKRMIAEVCGKVTGTNRGITRIDLSGEMGENHLGMLSGTLGTPIGYAVGAGLAAKYKGEGQVSVVTFGDGTINSGIFHEAMNLASMLCLPVIFVCQDNQYAISLPSSKSVAGSISKRGAGYGMPAIDADGNDVFDVYNKVQEAISRARAGQGPSFIHALSYRMGGHWAADPANYRPKEEVEKWAARDPIALCSAQLIAEEMLTSDDIAKLDEEARNDFDSWAEQGKADPLPGAEEIPTEAYAPSRLV